MSAIIPATYREWRYCVEVECAIGLTPAYLADLSQPCARPKARKSGASLRCMEQIIGSALSAGSSKPPGRQAMSTKLVSHPKISVAQVYGHTANPTVL